MKRLTEMELEESVRSGAHCQTFSQDTFDSFMGIWRERLTDAVTYHKRDDLAARAKAMLAFAQNAGSSNLKMYISVQTKADGSVFFLDAATHEFFQLSDADESANNTSELTSGGRADASPEGSST